MERMGRANLGRKEEKEFRFLHVSWRCPLDTQVENLRLHLGMQIWNALELDRGIYLDVIVSLADRLFLRKRNEIIKGVNETEMRSKALEQAI